jgi:hypothetical protein
MDICLPCELLPWQIGGILHGACRVGELFFKGCWVRWAISDFDLDELDSAEEWFFRQKLGPRMPPGASMRSGAIRSTPWKVPRGRAIGR